MKILLYKWMMVVLLVGLTGTTLRAQDSEVIFERTVGDQTMTVAVQREMPVIYRQHPVHGFAIRNNVAYDATGTPNLGIEIPLGDHVSLGANAGFKWWDRFLFWDKDTDKAAKWRHLMIAPEVRYYPAYIGAGHFISTDLIYMHYNVAAIDAPFNLYKDLVDHRFQGNFYGLGLSYGYSWWIGRRWRFEAEAGLAGGWRKAQEFECAWCGKDLGTKKGMVLIPKVGLNFIYTLGKIAKDE